MISNPIPPIPVASTLIHKQMPFSYTSVQLALDNLTTTRPILWQLDLQRSAATTFSWKERFCHHVKDYCSHMWEQLKTNKYRIGAFIVCTLICICIIALTRLSINHTFIHYASLKQDILNGKMGIYLSRHNQAELQMLKMDIYTNFVFLRHATLTDYKLIILASLINITIVSAVSLIFPMSIAFIALVDIYAKYKQNPMPKIQYDRLTLLVQQKAIDISPAALSNARDESGFLLDPLSRKKIDPDHICYPRYVKLGTHLFCLGSLINALLAHNLHAGKLKHPLENRYLHEQEQKEIMKKIHSLLSLNEETFLNCFNPFNISYFKIIMNEEEQKRFEQDTLILYQQTLIDNNENDFNSMDLAEQTAYINTHKQEALFKAKQGKLRTYLDQKVFQEAHLLE